MKLISFLIILVTPVKALLLNPTGPIHRQYATSCILEIFEKQFVVEQNANDSITENRLFTILLGHNMSMRGVQIERKVIEGINKMQRWPVEILSEKRLEFESSKTCIQNCDNQDNGESIYSYSFQPSFKTQFCFMVVEYEEDLLDNFNTFYTTKGFNAFALYVIYVPMLTNEYEYWADRILKYSWKNHVFNVVVIIPKNSLTFFNVYSLDGFSPSEMCGKSPKLLLSDTCKKGKMHANNILFENKLKKFFSNCTINAIANRYPPFVIDKDAGFEMKVLTELGKALQIKFNISLKDAVDWGTRNSHNNWTGLLQEAIDNRAVAIGNIVADPNLAMDFSLSREYYEEHMVWIVPIAAEIPLWKNIFIIFQFEVWIVCLVYFIFTAVMFQYFSNRNEDRYFRSFDTNLMASLTVLISVSCCVQPKTFMVRTFFILLAAFSMILIILYQTVFMTFLTNHVHEHQISTDEDILNSGMQIGGLSSSKDIFKDNPDIHKRYEIYENDNDTSLQWLLTVSNDRDTCTVQSRFYVKYLIANNNDSVVDAYGKPKVYILKKKVFSYPIRMIMPKGFPLKERFNKIIGYMTTGGFIHQWARYYEHRTNIAQNKNESTPDEHNEEYGALTLTHFNGAFNLLCFGYIFATGAFLMELIFFKFKVPRKLQNFKVKVKNKLKKY